MARDSKVGISLEATNRASGTIDQVKKSLGGLEGAAGVAAKGMAALGGAAIVGGIVSLGTRAAGAAVEMAQLAAQSQMVGNAMEGLAAGFGQSSDAMLDALKRASNGTIAEYDLMLGANKAMMLGVAQNAQELEGIMKVALTRGAAMGLSTTQAFDNLVTGLGRGSALILDNLGITMASLKAAEEEYAATVGKTTDALSDQEKKQAMVNAVLKEAAGVDMSNVEGMASSFAQAEASITNMKSALGELFGPAIAAVAKQIASAVEGINTEVEKLQTKNLDALADDVGTGFERLAQMYDTGGSAATFLSALDEQLTLLQTERQLLLQKASDAGIELTNAQADLRRAEANNAEFQTLVALEQQIERLTGTTQTYTTALESNQSQQNFLSIAIDEANARLAAQNEAMERAMVPGTERWQVYQDAMAGVVSSTEAAGGALNVFGAVVADSGSALEKWQQIVSTTTKPVGDLRTAAGAASVEIAKVGSAASGAVGGLAALAQQAALAEQALWNIENAARAAQAAMLATAISSLKSTALQAAGTLGVNEAMQEYETNARTLQQVGGYLAKSGMDTTEVQFNLEAMTQRMNSATLDQVRALEAEQAALARTTGSGGGGGSSGGLKGYTSALRDASLAGQEFTYTLNGLQSQVQGALSGALNLDVGVNVEDFLPREDAINENARRLADIMVNGFKGQDWLAEFAAEAPDVFSALQESSDPQGAAAQMLRDFQDGLLPGLIDKGAVKEKVKRAILGDASMSQLASEITAELAAEMGQNPAQVAGLVNQAMGRGAADASIDGQVITQLKSQTFLNSVNKAGSDAGASWGQWFLTTVGDNVPGQLLDILAVLVAPIVAQRNAAQATRTGAN